MLSLSLFQLKCLLPETVNSLKTRVCLCKTCKTHFSLALVKKKTFKIVVMCVSHTHFLD